MSKIQIPYNFEPRPYQLALLRAIDSGYTRAVAVWARRMGKDKTLINVVVKKALERVGIYYYFFPTYKQGKRVLWDGIDNGGFRFLDHIPEAIRAKNGTNNTEMKVTLINGSIIQIIGTDDVDRIRGSNPVGCVFSEFAFQNPVAWEVVRPILRSNGGWAVFNSTPFGKNHFYKLYARNQNNPQWFTQMITVETALDHNGNRFVTDEDIEEEIASGMSEDMVQQEFYCNFNASSGGFYYAKQMEAAEADGRITNVPYDESIPVDTWWDIGIGDSTAIWFTQSVNKEVRVIDYYENHSEGLNHYVEVLQDKKYIYGRHNLPHDIEVRELGTGKSRKEILENLLGSKTIEVIPRLSVEDGINAARMLLGQCWFDKRKCVDGIMALQNYHREYDPNKQEFKTNPAHDWSSHAADAFRYLAVGYFAPRKKTRKDKFLQRFKRNQLRKNNSRSRAWQRS